NNSSSNIRQPYLKAKRNSFRNMCTRAPKPFGLPYKALVKNRHPPADLFKLLGNPAKGDTSSFALSICTLQPKTQSLLLPVTVPGTGYFQE
ncbi:hypothetical protein AVEN_248908-1, partial [Araneus ventricosus]